MSEKEIKTAVFTVTLFLVLGFGTGIFIADFSNIDFIEIDTTKGPTRGYLMETQAMLISLIGHILPNDPGMETHIYNECDCTDCDPTIYIYYNITPGEWNDTGSWNTTRYTYWEETPWGIPRWEDAQLVLRAKWENHGWEQ